MEEIKLHYTEKNGKVIQSFEHSLHSIRIGALNLIY